MGSMRDKMIFFKRLIQCFCLTVFLVAMLALPGAAQMQLPSANRMGASSMDEQGVPYSSKYYRRQPQENVIALIRKPELTEDQFVLRITNPYVLSGCADISNYAYMSEYRDVYLDIRIESLKVDMRNQPRYSHFQCNRETQMPTADIILNRQDLTKNQTRQIRMHNATDTNYYTITLGPNQVKILPETTGSYHTQRFKPHNLPSRKTSLAYWFYPVGTLILWVPGMENTPQARARLNAFANGRELVPLQTIFPEFESPLTNSQFQYYVDTGGQFAAQEPALRNGAPIGALAVEKTIFGLDQDHIVMEEKTVYARTPGMYD